MALPGKQKNDGQHGQPSHNQMIHSLRYNMHVHSQALEGRPTVLEEGKVQTPMWQSLMPLNSSYLSRHWHMQPNQLPLHHHNGPTPQPAHHQEKHKPRLVSDCDVAEVAVAKSNDFIHSISCAFIHTEHLMLVHSGSMAPRLTYSQDHNIYILYIL